MFKDTYRHVGTTDKVSIAYAGCFGNWFRFKFFFFIFKAFPDFMLLKATLNIHSKDHGNNYLGTVPGQKKIHPAGVTWLQYLPQKFQHLTHLAT